jgi:hypothetical protein
LAQHDPMAQIQRVTHSQFSSQQWFGWENRLDRITVAKDDFKLGKQRAIACEAASAMHNELFVQIGRRS